MTQKDIEVIVYRRPNMFVVNENMYNLMGINELEKFFTIPDYKGNGDEIMWFYPERFLNIPEQRALVERLLESNYKKVKIVTHSVFIIQSTSNVKVADVGEDLSEHNFKLSWDNVGMPDDSGLNVRSI